MSLLRYSILVVGVAGATFALAWALALRLSEATVRGAAAFGAALAVPNTLAAHALVRWSERRSTNAFLGTVHRQALAADPWRQLLLDFLLGNTDQARVLAQVTDARQYLMAHFYIGVDHMLNDRLPEAMRHLRAGLAMGATDANEQFLAYSLLARLDGKTTDWCCRVENY